MKKTFTILLISLVLFACGKSKETKNVSLKIVTSGLNSNGKLPKDLIELLLPFENKENNIFFKSSVIDIRFETQPLKIEDNTEKYESFNRRKDELQKFYEKFHIIEAKNNGQDFEDEIEEDFYLKRMELGKKIDSTFIFSFIGTNKNEGFIEKLDKSYNVLLYNIKSISEFQEIIGKKTANKKNINAQYIILYNAKFNIIKKEEDPLKESERLRNKIKVKQDSLLSNEKRKKDFENEKDELIKLRGKTSDLEDRNKINEQIKKLESAITQKDAIIVKLNTELKSLKTQFEDAQEQLKKEKTDHAVTKGKLIQTEIKVNEITQQIDEVSEANRKLKELADKRESYLKNMKAYLDEHDFQMVEVTKSTDNSKQCPCLQKAYKAISRALQLFNDSESEVRTYSSETKASLQKKQNDVIKSAKYYLTPRIGKSKKEFEKCFESGY